MLTDIYGDLGSGKTLFMTYVAWKNPDIPVISDFKLNLPNYLPLEIDELLTLKCREAIVLFDEFDVYMNNRRAMSNLNIFLNNAIKQSRKRGLDILGSSQLFDSIDFKFSRLCKLSIVALGSNYKKFYYDLIYHSVFGNRIVNLCINITDMEKLYDKYDTEEAVMPQNIESLTLNVKSQKKLNQEVEEIADEIISRKEEFCLGKKITEKKLHDVLLQMEKPEDLAFYLASRLEQKLSLKTVVKGD